MPNILINPSSGILEFSTGTAGSSSLASLSGAARLSFQNSGELNLTSYSTGTLDRFSIDGSQGRLFSVNDSLSGTIFSVNDIAGLPIIEVNSTTFDTVNIGSYGTNALYVSGSNVGVGTTSLPAKFNIYESGLAASGGLSGSAVDIRQIWNTTGVATAVKLNATDTASNASSLLMDLQVGGSSKFRVGKNGEIYFGYASIVPSLGWQGTLRIAGGGLVIGNQGNGITFASSAFLSDDSAASASHIMAQRNGTNAQTFRIYGTHTSSTNFERLNIQYNGTATAFQIGTEKGSVGGTARALELQTDATTRILISTGGNVTIGDSVRTDLTLLDLIARGDGDAIRLYSKANPAGGSVNPPSISFYRSITTPSASARFKIAGHNGSDFSGFSLSSPDISVDWIKASNNLNDLGLAGTGNVIASYQRHYFFNSLVVGKDWGASTPAQGGTIRSGQKVNNVLDVAGSDLTIQAGAGTGSSTTGGNLYFQTPNATVSGTDIQAYSTKLSILRSGSIGIGTTSPSTKLDIDSDKIRLRTAKTPASATDTGNAGDICWDTDYIYVCVATNTWKRSAISTWP